MANHCLLISPEWQRWQSWHWMLTEKVSTWQDLNCVCEGRSELNWEQNLFSQSFHYETVPCQEIEKMVIFLPALWKRNMKLLTEKKIILLLSSVVQFKADRKESQLFVKHIDLKYERNLWGRRKEHGLLVITETPLICVANKAEWNRWDALDSVRQVLSL